MFCNTALVLATVVQLIAAQCSTTASAPTTPTKPAADPFWAEPSDLDTRAQGNVFRCRAVNWASISNASSHYQYAYKTINANREPIVAVATLILPTRPRNLVNGKYKRLLSYQIPYNSATSFCGPSFVNDENAPAAASAGYKYRDGQEVSPSRALQAGIPVVISDFEGSTAGFGVGLTAGYGTLNGVRAVLSYSNFFAKNTSVVLWGSSGGALATEFAVELADNRADDLNIVGAAMGSMTPSARNTIISINGDHPESKDGAQGFLSLLIPPILSGISNENATLKSWIQSNLKTTVASGEDQTYKQRFNVATSDSCTFASTTDFFGQDFNEWFKGLPASGNFFDVPIVSDALNIYGTMGQTGSKGRSIPTIPLYVYKGTYDGVSKISETDALVKKYCNANKGARIQYVRYSGVDHLGTEPKGNDGAWAYILDRFNGVAAPSCSTTTIPASAGKTDPDDVEE